MAGSDQLFAAIFASVGALLFVIGYFGDHWVDRRQFYRRNDNGVEEFKSYGSAVATSYIEGIVGFLSKIIKIIGGMLFVLGTLGLVSPYL
ncbi:hypothetical protein ThidrDRAFT_0253 [Thiorhodococcus drewsii AZ1]|uniref:Uncharacterized protein n=1 Tax=Thiorhodococcus drewsii AZ1 TaxID=765913 RepID=G2DVT3_9GAMM|nr:hypothetical protein [Thiorhodococcus drewsii]EGV34098.1 hypothetical protein ThidrDRAFT_0253 [Thiorhodococcus drewsii AZ1]